MNHRVPADQRVLEIAYTALGIAARSVPEGVRAGAVEWPATSPFHIEGLAEEFSVYEGTVEIVAPLEFILPRSSGVARVELVVGLDTFRPVTVDDPAQHRMHTESYRVDPEVLARCEATRAAGHRVVAIGTTTVRALESAATRGPFGRTDLFIRRPYPFRVVDVLLTNFHLPRTTLLVMIDAFVGPRWRALYDTARTEGYRFLSFGDAMLLERADPPG